MTQSKLSICAVLLATGLAGACSSSSSQTGTGGTGGGAGTGGASAGSTGSAGAGTGGASAGSTGSAGAGTGGASAGSTGSGGAGGSALVTPTELVSVTGCGNLRLVVSGGKVYFTNKLAGTVSSVAVTGGAPTVIAMTQNTPNSIAVDDTSVYWGNDGDRTVMKEAIASGTAAIFVPAPTDTDTMNVANALLVSGTTLYIGRGVDTYKMATSGGAMTQLSHSPDADKGYPGAFALDATHLYQPELQHDAISRETLDGLQDGFLEGDVTRQTLAPDRIAVSRSSLVTDAIAISGQNVVWANGVNVEFHDKDKDEKEGTLSVVTSTAGFHALSGFLISDGKLYLGETEDNNVEVVPLSFTPSANPPTPTVIAMNQANAAEFAADDTSIYYMTLTRADATGVCKIMKLPKQ
jgi:hypothetical protein